MKRNVKIVTLLIMAALLAALALTVPTVSTSAVSNPNNVGMVEFARKALNEEWGYFYGSFGQVATQNLLDSKAKQYPSVYNSRLYDGRTVYQHAQQWLGRRVVDCIGLMKGYLWWDSGINGPKYDSKTDKGANSTYNEATKKGAIETIPETHGVLVWRDGHIGVYVGNGKVIEARGTAYGVVETNLFERSWTGWCYYKNMSYKTDTDGLYKINGSTYQYVNKEYKKGWFNGRYFGQDGKMRTGTKTIAGASFQFASDGKLQNDPGVTVICVDKSLTYLGLGKSTKLGVTSNKSGAKISWSTSDKSVAIVSANGTVQGLKEGTAVITAKEQGGHTSKCTVKVQNVYRILSAKASNTKPKPGQKVTFTILTGINDESMKVYVNGTLYQKYVSGFTRGTDVYTWTLPLTFNTLGTYTVKFVAGTDAVPSNAVSVVINVRNDVTVPETMNMKTGTTQTLSVESDDPIVSYTSSNKKIATVSETGEITAIKPGSCVITVENSQGKTGKTIVIVDNKYVTLRIGYSRAIQNDTKTTIDTQNTKPYIKSGRTMVPMRFVGEKMGARVKWTANNQPVIVTYGGIKIEFTVGKKSITLTENGKTTSVAIDCAPELKGGRIHIPLRAVSQSLGFQVKYDDPTRVIVVSDPSMCLDLLTYRYKQGAAYITK